MNRKASAIVVTAMLILGVSVPGSAADLEISPFEFVTRGSMVDNSFALRTYGDVGLTLRSGFVAQPSVTFGLESAGFLEPYGADGVDPIDVTVRSASVEHREFLGSQLSLTYFLGESDRLGSGRDFPERFGTDPIATQFNGVLYFPDEPRYEGMHGVEGTGLALKTNDQWNTGELSLYMYQDNRFSPGVYSTDMNAMFDFGVVQMEAFAGGSWPVSDFGRYRAGVLANLMTAEGDSLLIQVALPSIEPGTGQEISVDDFFFLLEPRVSVGALSTTLSFFWQPEVYDQVDTGDGGNIDTNLSLQLGDIRTGSVAGGIETRVGLEPESDEQFSVSSTPFVDFNTGGVTWSVRSKFTLVPFDIDRLFEGYLGVRTGI